jgi:hypothetical protein
MRQHDDRRRAFSGIRIENTAAVPPTPSAMVRSAAAANPG